MTDEVLKALLRELRHESLLRDEASLMALSDRLMDVSPADRLEALAELVLAWQRYERVLRDPEVLLRNPHRFAFGFTTSVEAGSIRIEEVRREQTLERCSLSLVRAIDPQHWYAIRFDWQQVDRMLSMYQHERQHRLNLYIAPLTGGRVRTAEGG